MKELTKKGQFGLESLQTVAITVVIVAVVAVLGLQLLGDQQDDLTANSAEYNATAEGIDAVAKIPAKLPMIVGVIVLVIVIVILIASFRRAR